MLSPKIIEKLISPPVALIIGSAIGFVVNHLIILHSSKKERINILSCL